MKAYAKFTPYFIIIILLVIIVFLRECNKPKPCPEPTTTTETIIKHDTVRIKGEDHYYPVYTEVHDTIIKHLSKEDSARIIADYITGRNYNLLIVDDTNATINFYATVQFNKIAKWNYEGKYYPKTITTTITNTIPEVKRAKVFLGFCGSQEETSRRFVDRLEKLIGVKVSA